MTKQTLSIKVFFAKPDAPCLCYVVTLVKGMANREYYFIDAKAAHSFIKYQVLPARKKRMRLVMMGLN